MIWFIFIILIIVLLLFFPFVLLKQRKVLNHKRIRNTIRNLGYKESDFLHFGDGLLVINKIGVSFISVRNISGYIYGSDQNSIWRSFTGIIKPRLIQFANPIKENVNQIKVLKKLLGKNIPIFNIIIFPNSASMKYVTVGIDDTLVIRERALFWALQYFDDERYRLSGVEIDEIYNKFILNNVRIS